MKASTLAATFLALALAACSGNTINTTSGTTSGGGGTSGTTSSSSGGAVPAPVTQTVTGTGATVSSTDGSGVTIPSGALTASASITVTATAPNATLVAAPNATLVGTPYVFTPATQTFASPVTITLAFVPSDIPAQMTSANIVIQSAAVGSGVFTPLQTTVVDATHVSAQTNQLGVFEATIPDPSCGLPVYGYPGNACAWGVAVGNTFPDISLAGGAVLNFSTSVIKDSTTTLAPNFTFADLQALSLPANGGFRYAFLDISAVWCPHCNDEAQTLPGSYVPTWLKEGGIIFSVLVQSGTTNNQGIYPPASVSDLDAWIAKYSTNYPMSLDTEQNMVTSTGLTAWPANIIIRLSDMTVIDSVFGAGDSFYDEFGGVLVACGTTADCWSGATCNSGQCQ